MQMTCEETGILLHALIDDELDAGHAHEIEGHVASCPSCASQLRDYRRVRQALSAPAMRYPASSGLRARIEGALPPARAAAAPSRRSLLKGFAAGGMMSAAIAASLVVVVVRQEADQRILGDAVSAHLRALQGDHLIDVASTDQHTVKPWFNGKLDVAPPVVDLTPQGFALIGGRLDYLDGRPVAAIVYKRRAHVINLFVAPAGAQAAGSERGAMAALQGFNVWRWAFADLRFVAVSDINAEELQEFGDRLEASVKSGS
jgi:anti-sigma factor RsiW